MVYRKLTALALCLLLCGCSKAGPPVQMGERETVVLNILCEREDWDIVTQLCDDFARAHRDKGYAFSLDEPPADIVAALKSGYPADVLCFSSDMTEQLAENELLLAVEDNANRLTSSVRSAVRSNVQYGFPYSADTYFLCYDRSKFTEHEVEDLNRMMSKRLEDTRYSFAMPLDEGAYQSAFFLAAGCNIPEDCCSERGMLAGEYMAALADSEHFAAEHDGDDIKAGFVNGTVAAAVTDLRDSEAIKSTLGSHFGSAKLPCVILSDGSSVQLGSLAVYGIAGVSAYSDAPEEALAFAEWIAGEEAQRLRLEARSIPPVMKSLCDDISLIQEYPEVASMLEQLEYSVPILSTAAAKSFDEAAEELCDTLLEGCDTRAELYEALKALRDTCT